MAFSPVDKPKTTPFAPLIPVNPLPRTATAAPPLVVPEIGLSELIVGAPDPAGGAAWTCGGRADEVRPRKPGGNTSPAYTAGSEGAPAEKLAHYRV